MNRENTLQIKKIEYIKEAKIKVVLLTAYFNPNHLVNICF